MGQNPASLLTVGRPNRDEPAGSVLRAFQGGADAVSLAAEGGKARRLRFHVHAIFPKALEPTGLYGGAWVTGANHQRILLPFVPDHRGCSTFQRGAVADHAEDVVVELSAAGNGKEGCVFRLPVRLGGLGHHGLRGVQLHRSGDVRHHRNGGGRGIIPQLLALFHGQNGICALKQIVPRPAEAKSSAGHHAGGHYAQDDLADRRGEEGLGGL